MPAEAQYRPVVTRLVRTLEAAFALTALGLIAGGVYGLYAEFQPNVAHVTAMRGVVMLTWLPFGVFILADVMLFRRNIAKTFFSRAALVIVGLYVLTFLGALFFWDAGVPAWLNRHAEGPAHSYSYTIIAKSPRYDSLLCPGALTISTRIWFRDTVCAPEEIWRAAKIGQGLTLFGTWTPEGLRYDSMALKN